MSECSIAAGAGGRSFFSAVVRIYYHGKDFQIVSPSFGVHLFCTMGCFRRYISFRLPKAISSAFGSAPYESSFLIGWRCWWTVCHCLCLVFVMVGLFVIAFPTSAPLALGLCAADYCP